MTRPKDSRAEALRQFEERLGHRFRSPELLQQALTHSSVQRSPKEQVITNERLEFLGDRVLGLIIADLLHHRFPDEPVGAIARRHAALVRREALESVARAVGLPPLIRMSRGEEEIGGRTNPSLLADACEAVIAALYLDGGLDAARAFIATHWNGLIKGHATPPTDAKTALQEWLQSRGLPPPVYREAERTGPPHAPTFAVEAVAAGGPPVRATGPSKRVAEQAAAEALLASLRQTSPR